MVDATPARRVGHIGALASLVETSFGGDAAVLGEFMRESGGVELLLECVADAAPDVHQPALLVLGNLVSGAFEPGSPATKKLFNAAGGADVLLPHLLAGDWATQLYAVATVQNLAEDARRHVTRAFSCFHGPSFSFSFFSPCSPSLHQSAFLSAVSRGSSPPRARCACCSGC